MEWGKGSQCKIGDEVQNVAQPRLTGLHFRYDKVDTRQMESMNQLVRKDRVGWKVTKASLFSLHVGLILYLSDLLKIV